MPSKDPDSKKGANSSNSKGSSRFGRDDKENGIFDRFKYKKKSERLQANNPIDKTWSVNDLVNEMQKLGLEPAGLGKFIASLHKLAVASGVNPSLLASIIRDLSSLSEGKHPALDQIRRKIQQLGEEQNTLTKKIAELQEKKGAIEAQLIQSEEVRAKDKESMTTYLQLQQNMQEMGCSIDDVSKMASMVASAKRLDNDHSAIIEFLSDMKSTQEKKARAESDLEQLLETKRAAQQRVLELEHDVAEKQDLLRSAENLGRLGFGSKDLDDLSDAVRMIAKIRSMDNTAAKDRLISDLQSYYANDQELRGRLRTLEALVREKEEKFSLLETDFRNEKAVLDNASNLISAGLDEKWLAKLRSIIDSYGTDLNSLANELQARNGLRASIEELAKTKKALEEEERILRQKVVAAEDQRIKTLSLINNLIVHPPLSSTAQGKELIAAKIISPARVANPEFLESAKEAIKLIRAKLPSDSPARLVLEHALLALKLESGRGK